MNFPVSKLTEQQRELVTVAKDEPLRRALTLMVAHDFSQLPVVDEGGYLTGVISEQSIARSYFYSNESVSLFELPVHQCQSPALTITPDADLFDALGRLQDAAALVVVKDRKPIGILTYYDATHFFRDVSEGLMYVEDIEVTLRQYIEAIFPDSDKLDNALIAVFGEDKKNPGQPYRSFEQFSFYNHMQFISHKKNWPHFERFFEPLGLFQQYMEQVRVIRNQLAHFRDEISTVQRLALVHARDWLSARPKPPRVAVPTVSAAIRSEATARAQVRPAEDELAGKYGPLHGWLSEMPLDAKQIETTFAEIEEVIGEELPASAYNHRSWWANSITNTTRARAWLQAGWRVSDVDMQEQTVIFERSSQANYQVFYSDVVSEVRDMRPDLIGSASVHPRNYFTFASGISGLRYSWAFAHRGIFRIELYIDRGNKVENEAIFDALKEHKGAIEERLQASLNWDRLDNRKACRVSQVRDGSITDSPEQLDDLRQWAVEKMPLFVSTFQPYLRRVVSE